MISGAEIVVNKSLCIAPTEKVLIVTDKATLDAAVLLSDAAKRAKGNVFMYVIKEHERPLKSVPDDLEAMIRGVTAAMTPFMGMAAEGSFRFELLSMLKAQGARVAHMPGITLDILQSKDIVGADVSLVDKYADRVLSALSGAQNVRITAANGTDLSFCISGRRVMSEGGVIPKGEFFNFPSGEVFVAPLENSANGVFVCDVSCGSLGYVDLPIRLKFLKGKVVEISGDGKVAEILRKDVSLASGGKNVIGEFGIGVNPFFRPIGNVLVDEKVLGTCHVAIGDNTGFGGVNRSSIHVDFIVNKPTISADDNKIMREGKLNV